MRKYEDVFKEKDFLWGSATAAYQCEGAVDRDGKGLGEWDYFNHNSPFNILNVDGDEASDSYVRFKEDIDLLKEGSQNTYRFSIAWSRILPNGTGEINQKGVEYYNKVIDYCIEKNIEPNVTLFHFDLPFILAKQGGWLNYKIAEYFEKFARVCFQAFGDRVKIWSTINEPEYFSYCANVVGNYPPNRHNDIQSFFQYQYNLMLASAKAVNAFKEMKLDGIIGVVHNGGKVEVDIETTNGEEIFRLADFFYNRMILSPALEGKLPNELDEMMNKFKFTLHRYENDMEIFRKGKCDYIGLNIYSRQYVKHWENGDSRVFHNNKGSNSTQKEGIRLENLFETSFDKTVRRNKWGREINPRVMYSIVMEVSNRYNKPLIFITENGHGMYETPDKNGYVEDNERIEIFSDFLNFLLKAKEEGANVKGYYHWSTMDLYSWINGYEKRYGLVRVDFENNFKRVPKKSFYWYREFIEKYFLETSK